MYISSLYDYDCDEVCNLTSTIFVKNEPICKCLGITEQEFTNAFNNIIFNCSNSGYSFSMKDHNTSEIVSVMLALPYEHYKHSYIPEDSITKSIKPLLTILDEVSCEDQFDSNNTLYLFIACTRDDIECKGFAKILLQKVIDNAKNNFKYIVADATNIISQHILINKFAFENIKEIHYKTFQFNGKPIFNNIQTTKSVIRVLKAL